MIIKRVGSSYTVYQPSWQITTRGVCEIFLTLRYCFNSLLLHYFKKTSTLYLEIIDYPGKWPLDLLMLEQDDLV